MPGSQNAAAGAGARLRRTLPLVVLGLALATTAVGAFQAQRAHRSHRETAEALLRDYGTFAAWSFSERATGFLDAAVRSTLHPPRGDLLKGDLACLEMALSHARNHEDSCGCGKPLGGRFAFHIRLAPDAGAATFVGDAPPEAGRPKLVSAVVRDASERRSPQSFRVVQVPAPGDVPMLLAYVKLEDEEAGEAALFVVEVDRERFEAELRRALEHPDLLPRSLTRGTPNTSLLAVQVLGAGGEPLFASVDGDLPPIHADQPLAERHAEAVVRAAVLPDAAEQLIIGGLPGNRTPLLLLLFGLAAGLMVLSVSLLRKETDLARLRSDFVASVSHELRTPVAQIRLFVETLRLGRARTEAEREWAIERIERETLRLGELVDRIVHFGRADRGAVPTDRELMDLRAEVADAATSFEALVRPGKARLALELADGLVAPVHPDSFRQVVLNLLENALKYGPDGQTIRVRAERRDAVARIAVEDQGPGVPLAERDLIWEPFRRGAAAIGSVAAGGGIGLAVVREIVRAHGGRSWVEDAPGGGARFIVELPASRAMSPERLTAGAAVNATETGAPAGAA